MNGGKKKTESKNENSIDYGKTRDPETQVSKRGCEIVFENDKNNISLTESLFKSLFKMVSYLVIPISKGTYYISKRTSYSVNTYINTKQNF